MIEVRVPVVPYPDPQLVKPNPLPRRLEGITLGVLPFLTILLLGIINPDYIGEFRTGLGPMLIGVPFMRFRRAGCSPCAMAR